MCYIKKFIVFYLILIIIVGSSPRDIKHGEATVAVIWLYVNKIILFNGTLRVKHQWVTFQMLPPYFIYNQLRNQQIDIMLYSLHAY